LRKLQKFQVPNTKNQTNPNEPNSKFQAFDQPSVVSNKLITIRSGSETRGNTTIADVLVIDHWNLRFICILVLDIWVFIIEGAWIAEYGKAATTIFDF
jgi:hypothetical protein